MNLKLNYHILKRVSAASAILCAGLAAVTDAEGAIVYFDNSVSKWTDIHAYAWTEGSGALSSWPGSAANKVEGYDELYSFDTGDKKKVIFNNNDHGKQTQDLTVADGCVFKMTTGDNKGDYQTFTDLEAWKEGSEPDPNPDPEPEKKLIWLEPEKPSVNQSAVLHFDASHAGDGYKDKNLSYNLWLWLVVSESSGTKDLNKLSEWSDTSIVMTQDPEDKNHYTYELTPDIANFFNATDKSSDAVNVGVIVRTGSGEQLKKVHDDNIFLPVKPAVAVIESPCGKYTGHEWNATTGILSINGENGSKQLSCYGPGVVKVFVLPEGMTQNERPSISVAATASTVKPEVTENEDSLTVTFDGCIVTVGKSDCGLSFADGDASNVLLAENGGLDNREGKRGVNFAPMGDEAFYGGGYNGRFTNLDGKRMVMNNTQTGGWSSTKHDPPHNICIPFYVSTRGYGVLFDDHYRGAAFTPSADGGTRYTTGSLNPIAYYYVGGGDMESAMRNYTRLTGLQQMPPYWMLGYITSRYGYRSFSEADSYINAIKGSGIPLDGVVFDLFWQGKDESGMGNLTFEPDNFASPAEWLSSKKEQGIHTIIITEPFFTDKSANYNVLKNQGFLADLHVANNNNMSWLKPEKDVGLIDASNPQAMEWMKNFYEARIKEGVDGMWLDLGEPEAHDDDSQHKGGTVAQVHNEFGLLWIKAVYETYRDRFPEMRPMLLPRSGTSGMQRYSTFPWSGDIERSWNGLKTTVPAMVSASMSGVSYLGSDIGGFTSVSGTMPELYLRWVQQGVFSPMMRTHSTDKPEPTNTEYDDIREDVKRFINLRYRYLPYTYTLAWYYASEGTPMARPVNFHNADPLVLSDCIDEYLWGRDLLVAPVLESATSRTVSFPEGDWMDMNDLSVVYQGGTSVTYDAPKSKLPYFGRIGSIIPHFTMTEFSNTASIDHKDYTLEVLADKDATPIAEGYLFEDDMTTPSVNEGYRYLLTRFAVEAASDGVHITVRRRSHDSGADFGTQPLQGLHKEGPDSYTFVIHNWTPEKLISIGNQSYGETETPALYAANAGMTKYDSPDSLKDVAEGYATKDNKLYVKITVDPSKAHDIMLQTDIHTGIDSFGTPSDCTIAYAGGNISYSMPEGWSDGHIGIYTPAGTMTVFLTDLTADGYVHQENCMLAQGVYIITLTADDTRGNKVTRTVKTVVR